MDDMTAEIALFDRVETESSVKDRWMFTANHKWGWVRKLQVRAFHWLVKHGALTNPIDKKVVYKTVTLSDKTPSVDTIRRVVFHIAREGYRPKHLYLGPAMANAMMRGLGDSSMRVLSFTSGLPRQIMGIPFTVVPWMRGWVIVPEDR